MKKRTVGKTGKRTRRNHHKNEKLMLLAIIAMIFSSTVATYAEQQQTPNVGGGEVPPPTEQVDLNEFLNHTQMDNEPIEENPILEQSEQPEPTAPTTLTNAPYSGKGTILSVYFHKAKESGTMGVEEYLLHVMGGEIPYTFKEEALKAQAVAARSYVVYRMQNKNEKAHENGEDICTNPAHCLAYAFEEDFATRFGDNTEKAKAAYTKAIQSTKGEILTYDDQVALGVFHAMSGGQTESANTVWGGNYPYLTSASSKGEENYKNFETTVSIPLEEFQETAKMLGATEAGIAEKPPVQILKTSSGGGVTGLLVYDAEISGTKARSVFGLRTNLFEISQTEEAVVFRVLGWGHRVGMSQYGAEAMAKNGASYLEILGNYYQNCKIEILTEN